MPRRSALLSFHAHGCAETLFDDMDSRQHALMEDSDDENPIGLLAIENDVPPMFHAAISGPSPLACAAQRRRLSKFPNTFLKLIQITQRLVHAPISNCVPRDCLQISERKA